MEKMTSLLNGTEVYELEIENDFKEAQSILDLSDYTENIDAYSVYNDRVDNDFIGTYKVTVQRQGDYNAFLQAMRNDIESKHYEARQAILNAYHSGNITIDVARGLLNEHDDKLEDEMNKFKLSFNEWKSGKMENGAKVGKTLRKNGFSQDVIDFYSVQVKTEKDIFLTISDRVQHVTGMSYYSVGDWDSMEGSSCQNPEIGGHYATRLGGSLHDDKLFIAFTHESMEDLEDMEEKMIARVVMRHLTIDNIPLLVATHYYGNNKTKDELHNALSQLHEVNIYDKDSIKGSERVVERTNGTFSMLTMDYIEVYEDYEEEVSIECPYCNGHGYRDIETNSGRYAEIDCPLCGGDGTYYTSVYINIEHDEEIEEYEDITPYDEGYSHSGNSVSIRLNLDELDRIRESFMVSNVSDVVQQQ